MSNGKNLIPVFVPTLATMLAIDERRKGSPLTPQEIEATRDNCTCIMLDSNDAGKLAEGRGYVDVNPQNCWVDWHRLRVQMTGNGYLPKIVLCIPGDDQMRSRCEPILQAEQIEHEFRPHDPKMVDSFKSSSMTWPGFSDADFAWIARHTSVLYVLSRNFGAAEAPAVGRAFLNIGRRLLDQGGVAIKCDSAGISHPKTRWDLFDTNADKGPYNKWSALFHAYCLLPIGSETDFYSCGMHLLGAPDMIISKQVSQSMAKPGQPPVSAAVDLFRAFGMYLVAECPTGTFASGHTFSVDAHAKKSRMIWEGCDGFDEDDFFFNPFGRWRFTV